MIKTKEKGGERERARKGNSDGGGGKQQEKTNSHPTIRSYMCADQMINETKKI